MPINSRQKGARGERLWRDILRDHGFNARRGQQFSGGGESPDVVCPDLPSLHWEVKFVEAGNPYVWMQQAREDAGEKTPIVAHKRSNQPWLCIMLAEDFLNILKETDRCSTSATSGQPANTKTDASPPVAAAGSS